MLLRKGACPLPCLFLPAARDVHRKRRPAPCGLDLEPRLGLGRLQLELDEQFRRKSRGSRGSSVLDRPIAWRQLPRYPWREPNVSRCLHHFVASQRCAAIAKFAKRRSNMSAQITPAQLPVALLGHPRQRAAAHPATPRYGHRYRPSRPAAACSPAGPRRCLGRSSQATRLGSIREP